MKVIFLDIDGVIITRKTCRKWPPKADPTCVEVLNELIKRTGAVIVVSSCWRVGRTVDELQELLDGWGVKGIVIGRTGAISDKIRGLEIGEWLLSKSPDEVSSFVIIDDDRDMGTFMRRLVKTEFATGFTVQHLDKAVSILEKKYHGWKGSDLCVG